MQVADDEQSFIYIHCFFYQNALCVSLNKHVECISFFRKPLRKLNIVNCSKILFLPAFPCALLHFLAHNRLQLSNSLISNNRQQECVLYHLCLVHAHEM